MTYFGAGQLAAAGGFFDVLATTPNCQIATMVLREGEVSGEFGTDHPQADQVLLVLSGRGVAQCEDEERELGPRDVVLIPAGARHQIRQEGAEPLRSLNLYAPVAYPEEA